MHAISQFWSDIRNLKNIDLYLAVFLAIGIALLDLLGADTSKYLQPLTLAVLAILALSNVASRHQVDELHRAMVNSPTDFFLEEFPEDFKSNFESATEVWLLGVSLHRTINFNYSVIERKLQQGHHLKVMVVHPEGPGVEMAVSRNYSRKEIRVTSTRISDNLQLLCDLKAIAPGHIEIRTIQNPLSYGVVATNPNAATGALYIEHYTFGVSPISLPRFVIRAGDGKWYDFFKKEILSMWDYGKEWECFKLPDP